MTIQWALITGEYPPDPGGVSDYSFLVAKGLAAAGDLVKVYTPRKSGPPPDIEGVVVRSLPDQYGIRSLIQIDRDLHSGPKPDRVLVQYVPHAFGWKAMNVPFAEWLNRRVSKHFNLWVMFHEVSFPLVKRPLRHRFLSHVNRYMARSIAQSAKRIFVSSTRWGDLLHEITRSHPPIEWRPVPSNILEEARPDVDPLLRSKYLQANQHQLIGHFGTYGNSVRQLMKATLPEILLADSHRAILLMGKNSLEFRDEMRSYQPLVAERIHATGMLPSNMLATYMLACDWIYQPYDDGVSTRRTSLMGALALGCPIITTLGPYSEPIWEESDSVLLAPSSKPYDLIRTVDSALRTSPEQRLHLGKKAAQVYEDNFALEHTLNALRSGKLM